MLKNLKSILLALVCVVALFSSISLAQWDVTEPGEGGDIKSMFKNKPVMKLEKGAPVEMQADQVQYATGDNLAKAIGHVTIKSGDTTMYADRVDVDRNTHNGVAKGHVYVDSPQFQVDADQGTFNFAEKTGSFENARIFQAPLQIKGRTVSKVAENHMVMEQGFMTTCDHDVPHFRMQARRMDVYPGDKAIARGVTMFLGRVPIMHLGKYVQDLKNKPWFTFMPGSDKDLGLFMLTRSRFKLTENTTTTLLLDAYERQGFGWGSETKYKTPKTGEGLLRTYFINERAIGAKHPWQMKTQPTIQNERYRLEWRHKWDIDPATQAIWQYYRLSDNVLLPKYFERESRRDTTQDTYFLLSRSLPVGAVNFRVDHRVNRFVAAVDRTPEITYTATGIPLGKTGLYWATNNGFANLVKRAASPTEDRRKTARFDTDNLMSYPTRVAFIQFTPNVGGEMTYYSRTNDDRHPSKLVRGIFKTGADLTTRFMKVYNMPHGLLGSNLKLFRHIIAPTVTYKYQHAPSFAPSRLNQFDGIDARDKEHYISFGLENKIQTKRGKDTFDLLRWLATVDYTIKQKGVKSQLGQVRNLVEVTPNNWFKMVSDTTFDHRKGHLSQGSFDFYFTKEGKYGLDIGDHFVRGGDHQFIAQFAYIINPKWKFKIYNRFDVITGTLKEEQYSLTRDLHEWELNMVYHQTHGTGIEFMMSFTLKAFPDQPFDLFGTSFHQRKAGSQSTESP